MESRTSFEKLASVRAKVGSGMNDASSIAAMSPRAPAWRLIGAIHTRNFDFISAGIRIGCFCMLTVGGSSLLCCNVDGIDRLLLLLHRFVLYLALCE